MRAVVNATAKRGGQFAHVVLTVRHNRDHKLSEIKTAVMTASRKARSGEPWKRIQARMAAVGILSAPEVTWNAARGWHFHIHMGVACLSDDDDGIVSACQAMVARYMGELRKLGYDATWPAQFIAITDDADSAADYITKGSAWEIAGGAGTKRAGRQKTSLTPFQIAAAAAAGNDHMKRLWLEYANAMVGTRSCIVTKAMATALQLEEDRNSTREGEHNLTEVDNVIDTMPALDWNRIVKRRLAGVTLSRLETEGAEAWPLIRVWAVETSKEGQPRLVADDIPFDRGPPISHQSPSPSASEIVAKLAQQAREYVGGQKLIERERSRWVKDHALYGGFAPPTLADISRALGDQNAPVRISRALERNNDFARMETERREQRACG